MNSYEYRGQQVGYRGEWTASSNEEIENKALKTHEETTKYLEESLEWVKKSNAIANQTNAELDRHTEVLKAQLPKIEQIQQQADAAKRKAQQPWWWPSSTEDATPSHTNARHTPAPVKPSAAPQHQTQAQPWQNPQKPVHAQSSSGPDTTALRNNGRGKIADKIDEQTERQAKLNHQLGSALDELLVSTKAMTEALTEQGPLLEHIKKSSADAAKRIDAAKRAAKKI